MASGSTRAARTRERMAGAPAQGRLTRIHATTGVFPPADAQVADAITGATTGAAARMTVMQRRRVVTTVE